MQVRCMRDVTSRTSDLHRIDGLDFLAAVDPGTLGGLTAHQLLINADLARRDCRRAPAGTGPARDGPPLASALGLSRRTLPQPPLAQQMIHAGRAERL